MQAFPLSIKYSVVSLIGETRDAESSQGVEVALTNYALPFIKGRGFVYLVIEDGRSESSALLRVAGISKTLAFMHRLLFAVRLLGCFFRMRSINECLHNPLLWEE